ncbi:hypothetical protein ACEWPM_009610 [Roseovarius sp. S4756]|uniref:hypothetical protein n=1 Tax=Roseovarius maritimus TaxID=3342637 RepID=UPI00372A83E1
MLITNDQRKIQANAINFLEKFPLRIREIRADTYTISRNAIAADELINDRKPL